MNPSIDLRIGSLCRVMSDIIIPNLTDDLAVEQARLILGHLQVLRLQVDYAARYEELERRAVMRVAKKLCSLLSGGSVTQAAGARLSALLMVDLHLSPEALRTQDDSMNAAIVELVHASKEDGGDRFRIEARKLVLAQASASAFRNRSWFGAMGFEKPGTIDSIPDMMKKFEADMGQLSF